MTNNNQPIKKGRIIDVTPESDEDEGGSGGIGGDIGFVDFLNPNAPSRDDLPPDKQRHLLIDHAEKNKNAVRKGKEKRDHIANVKEGRLDTHGLLAASAEMAMQNEFKAHPVLKDKFAGVDDTESPDPNQNRSDTNLAEREELKLQYQKANKLEPAPAPSLHQTPTLNRRPGG